MTAVVVALALAPPAWTAHLSAIAQVLVPIQDAAASAAAAVTRTLAAAPSPSDAREQYLSHQVAALAARVAELERENSLLTATPGAGRGGGRLIRARVLGQDVAPWRATRRISAGTLRGVQTGDVVVSRHFSISAGAEHEVAAGYAVLLGEVLVGFVDQSHALSSRVQWIGDPVTAMNVRVGRHGTTGFVLGPSEYWLTGTTDGHIELRDVPNADVEGGAIAVGDTVLVAEPAAAMPAPLTIGTIASIEVDRANPLLSVARVESPVSVRMLHNVYVYSPHP